MIKNIIFFIESPFNRRDYNRFGIETLIENGFEVEIWDFTPFICPTLFEEYTPPDRFAFNGLKVFKSKSTAIEAVKKLSSEKYLVVNLLSYQIKTLEVYKTLSSQNILYGTPCFGALPSLSDSKRQKMNKLLSKLIYQPLSLINVFMNIVPHQLLGIKPMEFMLVGGEKYIQKKPKSIDTQIIHGCTLDYDLYLKGKLSNDNQYENSIVFLDQYLPFHPDYIRQGIPSPCKAEEYYPPLIKFFDTVETALDSKVIIAAHPRSNYDKHPDYFGGRKVLRGATHELVRQSKCVIAHATTSLSFAVLYEKPVLFVTLNTLQNYKPLNLSDFIELMANCFAKKPINLDKPRSIDWLAELEVDRDAYKIYRDSYIKSPLAPEKPCWQVFLDYVKRMN